MSTALVRVACPTCRAPYAPRLTDGRCPVCDAPAPAGSVEVRRTLLPDADDRLLAIVAVATIANVLLLGLLAVVVLSL
ncbi:MAG: hypothetical protein JWM64_2327 [Frankiales bacterium]|nr:hypothetical protein [Frankiales bacterium]